MIVVNCQAIKRIIRAVIAAATPNKINSLKKTQPCRVGDSAAPVVSITAWDMASNTPFRVGPTRDGFEEDMFIFSMPCANGTCNTAHCVFLNETTNQWSTN